MPIRFLNDLIEDERKLRSRIPDEHTFILGFILSFLYYKNVQIDFSNWRDPKNTHFEMYYYGHKLTLIVNNSSTESTFILVADAFSTYPQAVIRTQRQRSTSFELFNERNLDDLVVELSDFDYLLHYTFYLQVLHHLLKGTRPRDMFAED